MKKYFQSSAYIIFVIVTFLALAKAFTVYENPFDLYENPLVWIALIAFIMVIVMKELVNIVAQSVAEKLRMENEGIDPSTIDNWAWAKKLIKSWTKARDIEEEADIELDHNYDGIKELDNTLPPWWLYMFYATIIFGVIYLVRFHVLGHDNQDMEYVKEVEMAKRELAAYQASAPEAVFDIEKLTVLTDDSDLSRGKAVFNLNCAACHAPDGGGGIGPNLTDDYWILGGGIKNVFNTVSNGGRDGKGMVAWNKTLKPVDIQKVSSYILSLRGTTPAKPKAAEGDLYKEEGAEAPAETPAEENTTEEVVPEVAKDSIQ